MPARGAGELVGSSRAGQARPQPEQRDGLEGGAGQRFPSGSWFGSPEYRFRLKAANGEIIAVGEAYESKDSALNGIDSVLRNEPDATLDDKTD